MGFDAKKFNEMYTKSSDEHLETQVPEISQDENIATDNNDEQKNKKQKRVKGEKGKNKRKKLGKISIPILLGVAITSSFLCSKHGQNLRESLSNIYKGWTNSKNSAMDSTQETPILTPGISVENGTENQKFDKASFIADTAMSMDRIMKKYGVKFEDVSLEGFGSLSEFFKMINEYRNSNFVSEEGCYISVDENKEYIKQSANYAIANKEGISLKQAAQKTADGTNLVYISPEEVKTWLEGIELGENVSVHGLTIENTKNADIEKEKFVTHEAIVDAMHKIHLEDDGIGNGHSTMHSYENNLVVKLIEKEQITPGPEVTPTKPTVTPTPTPKPTVTPTPEKEQEELATPTPEPTPTSKPKPTITQSPQPIITPGPEPTLPPVAGEGTHSGEPGIQGEAGSVAGTGTGYGIMSGDNFTLGSQQKDVIYSDDSSWHDTDLEKSLNQQLKDAVKESSTKTQSAETTLGSGSSTEGQASMSGDNTILTNQQENINKIEVNQSNDVTLQEGYATVGAQSATSSYFNQRNDAYAGAEEAFDFEYDPELAAFLEELAEENERKKSKSVTVSAETEME